MTKLRLAAATLMVCALHGYANAKDITGGVYVATNNADENSVVGFRQFDDGTLEKIGEYKSQGKGTGFEELFGDPYDPESGETFTDGIDPIASSYGLWRSYDNKNVLLVNAGNGTVTSFRVQDDLSLKVTNVVKAGDAKPTSIASYKDIVYVASMGENAKDTSEGNIKGYKIDDKGFLTEIPNTTRAITGRPASVEFTPDGKFLAVVEISTGVVRTYSVDENGKISFTSVSTVNSPQASPERFFALPLGTKIIKGDGESAHLLVTETRFVDNNHEFFEARPESKAKYPFLQTFEGQSGSMTSYDISKHGMLSVISPDVISGTEFWDGQQAVCWVTVSPDGKYAWTTNPLTASISTYEIGDEGEIALKQEIAYQAADLDEYFMDLDLSADGDYINVLSGNKGTTWVFKTNQDGSLDVIDSYPGSAETHSYGLVTISYDAVKATK